MGGSNSTNVQLQEKSLLARIDAENIPKCKDHQQESLMFVCTEEKCKNKMELLCRECISKQRDSIHKNHRIQNIKEILQEVVSNFKRLDTIGAGNNSNVNQNMNVSTPNRSFSSISNNILTQGIPNDQEVEDSFKKLAADFMILSQNCKEFSEMIMQSLLQAREDGKKVDLEFTRSQTRKIMVDIANTCTNPNIAMYQQNVKKLEQFLKFDGIKAKFIDNDGNLRKQVKKGTTEWLNAIWEEMKSMTQAAVNIKNIGTLPQYQELINSLQKRLKSQQADYQLREYLKQQQLLQEQQQQELEEQMRQETQRKLEVEEFLRRQREEEENEQRRIQGKIFVYEIITLFLEIYLQFNVHIFCGIKFLSVLKNCLTFQSSD